MQPAQTIKNTYLERFNEMTLEYRLHFASRLFAWSADPDAKQLLDAIKNEVIPETTEKRRDSLFAIRDELIHKDYERDVNDYARRKPFFDSYPDLLLLHSALFLIRHWLCIYGVDERPMLYELIPKAQVTEMLTRLEQDKAAQRSLSTYFINTCYLYTKLYEDSEVEPINPRDILEIGSHYDRTNPSDVQILIYLYTHCILGETLFYHQPVSENQDAYEDMLEELEELIDKNYDTISLDNKFEFLVCSKICGFDSRLSTRIDDEADLSLNNEGFIVDTHNKKINPLKQSFLMSEHRNVLYIMSRSDPIFTKQ
jgi:hypothetical protein